MEQARTSSVPSSTPGIQTLPSFASTTQNPNTQTPTFHRVHTKQTQQQNQQFISQQSRTHLPPQPNKNRQQTSYGPLFPYSDTGVHGGFGTPLDYRVLQQQQMFSTNSTMGQCQFPGDLKLLLSVSNTQEFEGLGHLSSSLGSSSSPFPNTIQGSQLHQQPWSSFSNIKQLTRTQGLPHIPQPPLLVGAHQQQTSSTQQQLSDLHYFQEHGQQYLQPRVTQSVPHQLQASQASGTANQMPLTSTTLQTSIQSGQDADEPCQYIPDKKIVLRIIAQSHTELIAKLNEQRSTHQKRVEELEAALNSQAQAFSNLKKERDDQAARITVLETETESQTKLLLKHEKERSKLQQKVQDLEADAGSKALTSSNLEKKRDDLVDLVTVLESKAKSQALTCSKLEKERDELVAGINVLEKQVESQAKLLIKHDMERSTLQQKIRDLNEVASSKNELLSKRDAEISTLQQRVQGLEAGANSQALTSSKLEKERDHLLARVTVLEIQAETQAKLLIKHDMERPTLQRKIRDLNEEADSKAQAFSNLEKERDNLLAHATVLESAAESYALTCSNLEKERDDLIARVTALEGYVERFTKKASEIVAWFDSRSREPNIDISRPATDTSAVAATDMPWLDGGGRAARKRRFDGDGSNWDKVQ